MNRSIVVLALASLAGCKATGAFSCETSEQCRLNGGVGTCELTGFCSFEDSSCASGSRYDPLAGGGLGGQCVGDQPLPDAPDAAPPDPRCSMWTPPPQNFDACAIPMPNGDLALDATASPYTYDTTLGGGTLKDKDGVDLAIFSAQLPQANGPDMAVLSVESLAIGTGATLIVIGTKPLVIAVWSTAQIDGTIDAGSYRGVREGAGTEPAECAATAPTAGMVAVVTGGSGGGGGGGFHGTGGAGGQGDAGGTLTNGGAAGTAVATPVVVRGGCAGALSGEAGPGALTPSTATTISNPGRGGGAVRVVAFTSITLTGAMLGGGSGGEGAAQGSACGGGGGGAGGYLGLEAPTVTLASSAVLAANGGGGGGSGPFAGFGNPGGDATPNATAAPGGAAVGACGHAGSPGSAAAVLDGGGPVAADNCGGSGGGGGAGYILIHAPSFVNGASVVSPALIHTP